VGVKLTSQNRRTRANEFLKKLRPIPAISLVFSIISLTHYQALGTEKSTKRSVTKVGFMIDATKEVFSSLEKLMNNLLV
jgi:hypothetical protein